MSTETAHIRGISNVDNCDCGFDVLEEYIFRGAPVPGFSGTKSSHACLAITQ